MNRLIDTDLLKGIPIKDKLERNYQTFNLDDAYEEGWFDAIETIEKQPTVDAEPIRHGHWIEVKVPQTLPYELDVHKCSECKRLFTLADGYRYCPNCGALMDKEEEE